jgi:UDP-N-acetyl-2-amino-2-deoxyglucuronate dehydrogenase
LPQSYCLLGAVVEDGVARFALIGAAGFVAKKHLAAMHATGGELVAACDINDSVGVLDSYFPDALFYSDTAALAAYIAETANDPERKVDYCAVCSPSDLHRSHVAEMLLSGASVICEKPLTVRRRDLADLEDLERQTGNRVHPVLQMRHHPELIDLKVRLDRMGSWDGQMAVDLRYVTPRGRWYSRSWKGDPKRSGGLALNIGVHMFDLLMWLFGEPSSSELLLDEPSRMSGAIAFQGANVSWLLSIDSTDRPMASEKTGNPASRTLTVGGTVVDFSSVDNLHTAVYESVLGGDGLGIDDARRSIELVASLGSRYFLDGEVVVQ